MPGDRAAHLVSADILRSDPPPRLVLLDVRAGSAGRASYQREHLPGARFADIDTDLAGTATPESGARPLPRPDDLTTALHRWGINPDSTVVVYDDARTVQAARAWWVLRWAGVGAVRILDGGLRAWIAANGEVTAEPAPPATGTATARPGALPVADTAAVAELPEHGVLLDARPRAHYFGEGEYTGHIPGAVTAPIFDDFDEHGLLRDEQTLRTRYLDLGLGTAHPAASYCGSAMAAALQVFVLATLGIEIALYPGSLSQWAADPTRPIVGGTASPAALSNS
ncbi:sulfurtransferase [Nocardia sp. IBHARD005]|uniref:sulfurtransferase n=1 Tax=Nocardia sp. IBHARD005 TaxID=3457765 RepID=UPI004057D961